MSWEPVYASLTEMRDWFRTRSIEDTDDDGLTRLKLSAASRAVDGTCGRQFGRDDEPTTRACGEVRWSRTHGAYVAEIPDIMDTTGLVFTLDGVELTDDQWTLRPRPGLTSRRPYTYVKLTVAPTGDGELDGLAQWGWNAPWPDPVKEATMLQTSRLAIRRDSPYGIAGGSDSGAELRLLSRLDPDVELLLKVPKLIRTGWVAR